MRSNTNGPESETPPNATNPGTLPCVHEFNRRGLCRSPPPSDRERDPDTRRECDRLKPHTGTHAYRTVRLGEHAGPCSDESGTPYRNDTVDRLRNLSKVLAASGGKDVFFPSKEESADPPEKQPVTLVGYVSVRNVADLLHYVADMLEE